MRLETQDGYVFLEKDTHTGAVKISEELRRQLLPQWLLDEIVKNSGTQEAQAFQQQCLEEISAQLVKLSEDPQNWLDRGVPVARSKFKIGNTSVPLKEILWTTVAVSVPAFIAVTALVAGPASLLLASQAAAAVGPAIVKVYSVINKYSPTELDVHTAVAAAMNRNATKTLRGDGVTLEEIEQSFTEDSNLQKPRSLKAVLNDMASKKKQMLISSVDGGVEVYKLNRF